MALKAVRVSEVPHLDQVPEIPTLSLSGVSSSFLPPKIPEAMPSLSKSSQFLVIGHRGKGMNTPPLPSSKNQLNAIKENSILSFNEAARFPVDFVELDVQVTKDDCPVVFHDNTILTGEDDGSVSEKRITDLALLEFLSYGFQKQLSNIGKPLRRRAPLDGKVFGWNVDADDSLCTLQEAFQGVDRRVGFNIELKFDDDETYSDEELDHILRIILQAVFEYAKERPVIFSTFQPDAARLIRKLQSVYPVFFLTDAGTEIYSDRRRNSLDEAVNLCLSSGLHGIVSEVKGVLRNPSWIPRIKESNLAILTYGELNNVPEAVYLQHLMGIDGVIVDYVKEITDAVSQFTTSAVEGEESLSEPDGEMQTEVSPVPKFLQSQLSFLLKLIPELIQH